MRVQGVASISIIQNTDHSPRSRCQQHQSRATRHGRQEGCAACGVMLTLTAELGHSKPHSLLSLCHTKSHQVTMVTGTSRNADGVHAKRDKAWSHVVIGE